MTDETDETDEERDARFAPLCDIAFGPGNWVRCDLCPPDDTGRPIYHHRDAHPLPLPDNLVARFEDARRNPQNLKRRRRPPWLTSMDPYEE